MNEVENSIFKTIIYFDALSYPLKTKEIFENLQTVPNMMEVSFLNFKNCLLNLQNYLGNKDGFWFLKGREFLIEERKRRELISKENFKKLAKIAKKINRAPFLKGIFVSGSLAILNSTENSDIDLLVVAKKGRIFTVRFFLTILLDLMGERRKPGREAQKICLNHYLTEDSLEVRYPSLYNAYTYLHLLPILNRDNVFERFRKANEWMKDYIIFVGLTRQPPFEIEKSSKLAMFLEKKLSGSFGDFLEKKLKEIQIKRKEKKYPSPFKKSEGRVILEDNLIELHPDSPENKILREYGEKVAKIIK